MRVNGWEQALVVAIERHAVLPFEWGASDCFVLCRDAASAVSGEDPFVTFGRYSTELGAGRALRRAGCQDVGDLLAKHLEPVAPSLAHRGDLGVIVRDGRVTSGVFTSFGFAAKAEAGVFYEPVTAVTRAFKVS